MNKKNDEISSQIKVNISNEEVNGTYSNFFIINKQDDAFIFDYGFLPPGLNEGQIHSRIILSPKNAKRLCEVLKGSIKSYEAQHGNISHDNPQDGVKLSLN